MFFRYQPTPLFVIATVFFCIDCSSFRAHISPGTSNNMSESTNQTPLSISDSLENTPFKSDFMLCYDFPKKDTVVLLYSNSKFVAYYKYALCIDEIYFDSTNTIVRNTKFTDPIVTEFNSKTAKIPFCPSKTSFFVYSDKVKQYSFFNNDTISSIKIEDSTGIHVFNNKHEIDSINLMCIKKTKLKSRDPESIRKVVLSLTGKMRYRYNRMIKECNNDVSGIIIINFDISQNGNVLNNHYLNSTIPNKHFCKEVINIINGADFGKCDSCGFATVTFPFRFSPD